MKQAIVVFSSSLAEQKAIETRLKHYHDHYLLKIYPNRSECLAGCQQLHEHRVRLVLLIVGASIKLFDIRYLVHAIELFCQPKCLIMRHTEVLYELEPIINQVGVDALVWRNDWHSLLSQCQRLLKDTLPSPPTREQPDEQTFERRVNARVSELRAGFFDYTQLSDQQLAEKVIAALYKFFKNNDEQHHCRTYSKNHVLTREGESNPYLWFIASGEVVLTQKRANDQIIELARMHTGNLVGGMSFVSGDSAFTTGITTKRTEVIKLDRPIFAKVLASDSELLPLFTNLLLRHFNRRLKNSIRTRLTLHDTLESLNIANQQLIESEKMAQLGQLVAGIAHELNNPVAAINRGSETIRTHIPDLLNSQLSPDYQALGLQVLNNALTIAPLSTQAIRQRAKQLNARLDDNVTARQLVQMDLDNADAWQRYFAHFSGDLKALVTKLDQFHRVGTFLRNIDVCATRIAGLVRSLKHYAGQDPEQPLLADITHGIAETLVIFENRLKHYHVECDYQPLPQIACFSIALQQVWTNLISNALDAMPLGGTLKIAAVHITQPSESLRVTIEDNGSGIPKDIQSKIFELNYTTKKKGNFGLGIGLTVCQQIVSQHRGRIEVHSQLGVFTRFTVTLPVQSNLKEAQ
jgi:signal transduction histidine kinase